MWMKKYKELILWGVVIYFIQIAMILIRANYYFNDPVIEMITQLQGKEDAFRFDPVLYVYGEGHDTKGFNALEQNMWFVNIALYCVMVIQKMIQYKEENSYMIIMRYDSFYSYYKMVYTSFLKYTFFYQVFLFVGELAGIKVLEVMQCSLSYDLFLLGMAQVCTMVGNLFFGIFVLYFILHKDAWKGSLIIYPCMPIIAILLGNKLPVGISNLFPGSWVMLARSNLMATKGFSFWGIIVLEVVVFLFMSKVVKNRVK